MGRKKKIETVFEVDGVEYDIDAMRYGSGHTPRGLFSVKRDGAALDFPNAAMKVDAYDYEKQDER